MTEVIEARTAPGGGEWPAIASSVGVFEGIDPELIWKKYCGFLDLPIEDWMDIQEQLLLEQIDLIQGSPLGRRLLRGTIPKSVEEFRDTIPLTTYGDYVPFLSMGQDESLGEKAATWAHTTGAQADYKWVPYTHRGIERLLDNLMAAFILASTQNRGEVNIWPGATVLHNTPERPYVSGLATFGMVDRFGFNGVLSAELSEMLDFKSRVRQSFKSALSKDIDVIISMTSVLVKVGEGFAAQAKESNLDRSALHPKAAYRLAKAYLKSKILRRQIMPKDLWPSRAVIGWGIDTPFFREQVRSYWGRRPYEIYACTEGGIMGMQTWKQEGTVFNPYSDFYEFIPLEESIKSREDIRYNPKTVLLDEVVPGEQYEVVITNFYGMAFVRYRVGHMVEFFPRSESSAGIDLPEFTLLGRADDRIDLAGFTRLDEKSIWEALNLAEIKFHEWTIRKEFNNENPLLHLYIELRHDQSKNDVHEAFNGALKKIDPFYGDLEGMLGISPLRITFLSSGTYDRFYEHRVDAGAELGRLSPPHMNALDEDIDDLVRLGG